MVKDTLLVSGTFQFLWLSFLCSFGYFIAFIYVYDPENDVDEQALRNRENRIKELRRAQKMEREQEKLIKKHYEEKEKMLRELGGSIDEACRQLNRLKAERSGRPLAEFDSKKELEEKLKNESGKR